MQENWKIQPAGAEGKFPSEVRYWIDWQKDVYDLIIISTNYFLLIFILNVPR